MNRLFCLETEWTQSKHDLKDKSTVLSLLTFLDDAIGDFSYVFRQVATLDDFEFYIRHLEYPSYDSYDVVYLCFHGEPGVIQFADRSEYSLNDFAIKHKSIFDGRTVIFDCCSTLKLNDDKVLDFKKLTGAKTVIGYRKKVDFIKSFVFEFWLLNALKVYPNYGSKRIFALAEKEMPVYAKSLGFVCY